MAMLSLIVVSNDQKKLSEMLLASLQNQSFTNYELIVENGNEFSSAASAYNAGAQRAIGKYLLFLHQDIIFTSKNSLRKIAGYAELLDGKYAILGFAGIKINTEKLGGEL